MANQLEQLSKRITDKILARLHDFDTVSVSLIALDEDDSEALRRTIANAIEDELYSESQRGDE